ncbi:MAG: TrbI/VirB10 family protein [Hyphomonas sp.]
MANPIPFEAQAEALKIRARPRPVTRINRKVLMLGACVGAIALFAIASAALKPPLAANAARNPDIYNTTNKRTPEGLTTLPASYADLEPGTPQLGPPLAGDLGGTILAAERNLGIEPEHTARFEDDFRPNPVDEAARARRLREAAMAEDAARAPVFFKLAGTASPASPENPGAAFPRAKYESELLALAATPPTMPAGPSAAGDPNFQDRKQAFSGQEASSDTYNPHRVEDPLSPYQVMAGTLIPASLVTGINSDLPGTIIAQVTQPVYDTVTGQFVLIPQGSRLIGRYQSEVSFGQDRALVLWDRIIFPDGASITISEPSADAQGASGLADRTDHHWRRVFAAAGLTTLLGIGSELGNGDDDDIVRAIRRGTSDTVSQAGQRVVDRNLGIQPTIRVRPGWPVRVLVTRDLVLRPH